MSHCFSFFSGLEPKGGRQGSSGDAEVAKILEKSHLSVQKSRKMQAGKCGGIPFFFFFELWPGFGGVGVSRPFGEPE